MNKFVIHGRFNSFSLIETSLPVCKWMPFCRNRISSNPAKQKHSASLLCREKEKIPGIIVKLDSDPPHHRPVPSNSTIPLPSILPQLSTTALSLLILLTFALLLSPSSLAISIAYSALSSPVAWSMLVRRWMLQRMGSPPALYFGSGALGGRAVKSMSVWFLGEAPVGMFRLLWLLVGVAGGMV